MATRRRCPPPRGAAPEAACRGQSAHDITALSSRAAPASASLRQSPRLDAPASGTLSVPSAPVVSVAWRVRSEGVRTMRSE